MQGKTVTMIKKQFIDRQVKTSAAAKRTAPFLRRLVFKTVDAVSRSHYADDYPMKCVQTASASQMLLEKLHIESHLTMGAACFPKILTNGQFGGWTGFWDKHHHVWLETEYGEVVDLSISQLHEHPKTGAPEIQSPAIWWDQKYAWPPIIRYLFDIRADRIDLGTAKDQASYEQFLVKVQAAFLSTLANKTVQDISFSPLLSDIDQLNTWTEECRPWAIGALTVLHRQIAFPEWIVNREKEIKVALSLGEHPKSHLSDRDDLFG